MGSPEKLSKAILVAGIPASGKSTYARWLATTKGYAHMDVDLAPNQVRLDTWLAHVHGSKVNGVIDWGFPPSSIRTVEWLISQGVAPWWFDGDHDAARHSFLQRHTRGEHPAGLPAFEHQMAQIRATWDHIKPLFRGRIIRSVLPGPSYLEPKAIFERMKIE